MFGLGAIPLLAHWQNRFSYKQSNVIARMHLLYKDYDKTFLEDLGFSLEDIYIITLVIYGFYGEGKKIYLRQKLTIFPKFSNSTQLIIFKLSNTTGLAGGLLFT